jgi:hypothetical protein
MKTTRDIFRLVVTCAVVGLGLSGCGGGAKGETQAGSAGGEVVSGAVVASVGGSVVTESMLDHWVALQAAAQYEVTPKASLPAGVVPDPPEFRACIAYLRGVAQHERAPKLHSNAALLTQCQIGYRSLRTHALEILITFKWFEAEASRLGIKLTGAKLAAEFTRVRKEQFHSIGEYQAYLRRSDQTLSDEYQRLRVDLLSTALQAHFKTEGIPAVARYYHEFPRIWAAKTTCRTADLNPNCKEYKGSVAPEARI